MQAQLNTAILSQRGRWLLTPHQAAKSEWQLAGVVEHKIIHAIIDRSFIDETGTRWIVDYKTAAPEHGELLESFLADQQRQYDAQLSQYAAIVHGLEAHFEGMPTPIMLALYFPAVDGWRAWAWNNSAG